MLPPVTDFIHFREKLSHYEKPPKDSHNSSNESIKEITFQLGFDDPANFTKSFSKNAEMTPAQFRSAMKK